MSDVVITQRGRLGHVLLNRPQAINALTHEMVVEIAAALDAWATDDSVETVAISGAGERGLCAGGDVTAMYRSAIAEGADAGVAAAAFWADEYALNSTIAHYPKPYVALMTGVVLGGSIVGQHAAELISVIAVAVTAGLKVTDLAESLFVHPALAEALSDAAD